MAKLECTWRDAGNDALQELKARAGTLEGRKNDQGKDPWHLFPWDAARAIVKVLGFGASKYDPRNWEKGMAWSRPHDALIRHLTAWWQDGEDKDPETKMSHLWHVRCCALS